MTRSNRLIVLLVAACSACTGEITEQGGEDPTTPVDCSAEFLVPGPSLMRRLTATEYRNTVSSLLGVDTSRIDLPKDPEVHGFSNQSAALTLGSSQAEAYQVLAEQLAGEALANQGLRSQLVSCTPSPAADDICVSEFVAAFARRAYRRPLADSEVAVLLELANTEIANADPYQRLAIVVETVLQSPHFLFRVEKGELDDEGRRKLTDFEVATRLAYLLWQTTPDEDLLAAAAAGALGTSEQVGSRARAMLADERARLGVRELTGQWFDLDLILDHQVSLQVFPDFDPALRPVMFEEVERLIEDHVWNESADFLGIYDAPYGYGNDALAAHYGSAAPGSAELERLDFAGHPDRGGLFTTAGFLMVTSKPGETSSIHRGKYVRELALCDSLPPPPPDVPLLDPEPGESEVDASQRHMDDPACSGCHRLMDPIGWGLDRYAADGRVRETTENGGPPVLVGTLEGFAEPEFAGGVELGQKIASSEKAIDCAVQQVFRWSFARAEDEASTDVCFLQALGERFRSSGNNLPDLLVAVVESDAFRYLRDEE